MRNWVDSSQDTVNWGDPCECGIETKPSGLVNVSGLHIPTYPT